jgi:AcrR family transcriptional regulator
MTRAVKIQRIKGMSKYRIELRGKILDVAIEEFLVNGIKTVKMDDIASKMGISKRTMYELFTDKKTLVYQACVKRTEEYNNKMKEYASQPGHSVMDILLEYFREKMTNNRKISSEFYSNLHDKFPEVIEYYKEVHEKDQLQTREFITRGIEDGYFRNDIDYDVLTHLINITMLNVMNQKLYHSLSINSIIRNYLVVIIQGFCTSKGFDEMNKIVSKLDEM